MIVKEAERIILKLLSYVTNEDKNSGKYECTVQVYTTYNSRSYGYTIINNIQQQIEAAVAHKHVSTAYIT